MLTDEQILRSARNKLHRCGLRVRKKRNQNLYCVYYGDTEIRWFTDVIKLSLYADEVREKHFNRC